MSIVALPVKREEAVAVLSFQSRLASARFAEAYNRRTPGVPLSQIEAMEAAAAELAEISEAFDCLIAGGCRNEY